MLLSARMLTDVGNVNSFEYASQINWTEGDSLYVYVQLVDSSLDRSEQGFFPAGRRFVPASGSTLSIEFQNIDDSKKIIRTATQPFPEDASIWRVQILPSDAVHGAPQVRLTLTQPVGQITRGLVKNAVKIFSTSNLC